MDGQTYFEHPFVRVRSETAFTLIELLVVILIIGILIAVAAPTFLGQQQKAQDSEAKQELAIGHKATRAEALSRGGFDVASVCDDACVAAEIDASEPQLEGVTTVADLSDTASLTEGLVYVVEDATTNSHLQLVELSKSGNVITLDADYSGAPQFASTAAVSGGGSGGNPHGFACADDGGSGFRILCVTGDTNCAINNGEQCTLEVYGAGYQEDPNYGPLQINWGNVGGDPRLDASVQSPEEVSGVFAQTMYGDGYWHSTVAWKCIGGGFGMPGKLRATNILDSDDGDEVSVQTQDLTCT